MRPSDGIGVLRRVLAVSLALAVGTALALAASAASAKDDTARGGVEPTVPTTTTTSVAEPTTPTTTPEPPTTTTSTPATTTTVAGDSAAPETTITSDPRDRVKTRRRRAKVRYEFTSSEPGSSFSCATNACAFTSCSSPRKVRLRKGRHTLAVRATDAAGNTDASPATAKVKVKRKKRR